MNPIELAHIRRLNRNPFLLEVSMSEPFLGPEAQKYLNTLLSRYGRLDLHFRVQLEEEPVAVDEGGPFQLWLTKIAEDIFSPLAGLFLLANDGMIRINPIPLVGCERMWLKQVCKRDDAVEESERIKNQYRYAGRLLGLALRPWRSSGRAHPFCLGEAARLVPSLCKYLIQGDAFQPELCDLR